MWHDFYSRISGRVHAARLVENDKRFYWVSVREGGKVLKLDKKNWRIETAPMKTIQDALETACAASSDAIAAAADAYAAADEAAASDYTDVDVAAHAAAAALLTAHAAAVAASVAGRTLREAVRAARLMREASSRTEAEAAQAEAAR